MEKMNWKNLIKKGSTPQKGYKYKLNPDSDKSEWDIDSDDDDMYDRVYTYTRYYDDRIILNSEQGHEWWMKKEDGFL